MNRDEIFACLDEAAGRPSSGIVHDILPDLAAALDVKLNGGTAKPEKRVLAVDETR